MILVTGANGVVGRPLCQRLSEQSEAYIEVTRQRNDSPLTMSWDMSQTPSQKIKQRLSEVTTIIHCAPIWLLPEQLGLLTDLGVKRYIVFSSTSVLSKRDSTDREEQHLVHQLRESEEALIKHCRLHELALCILRPALIYGYGRDENVMHIARFIRRFGFMPLVGGARGLRQPVHADDLVDAALVCVKKLESVKLSYNLAGGDVISYREMVKRIFIGLDRRPMIIRIPLGLFRIALSIAAKLGRFSYTAEMANRMNQNLDYDYSEATNDLGFSPQGFLEQPKRDLPK